MSLKDTIELWKSGAEKAGAGQYSEAVDAFLEMPEPGSRIYFNVSSMYLRMGRLHEAEKNLDQCVKKDPHMALGYFQRGCLHLQNKMYDKALTDFDTALSNLRGNLLIDYKQLGLQYKLYSCEIMYNRAYAMAHLGQREQSRMEMEKAKEAAAGASESRQKIIVAALANMKRSESFQPYRLPKNSMVFWPPRIKTEVLKPLNFMQKAKVLSSIVDQDNDTRFAGAKELEQKRKRSLTPSPSGSRSPSPSRRGDGGSTRPDPPSGRAPRLPKPSIPPPAPNMKVPSRNSSLHYSSPTPSSSSSEGTRVTSPPRSKLPKPGFAPPPAIQEPGRSKQPVQHSTSTNGHAHPPVREKSPVRQTQSVNPSASSPRSPQRLRSPRSSPAPRSSSPKPPTEGAMTVKIHYTTTRALRVSSSITFTQLLRLVCRKFDRPENSLTIWYKQRTGDLGEITNHDTLKEAATSLEDGFRLTIWAYDKQESSPEPSDPVIMEVIAIADYTAQYSDELTFSVGEKIQVTVEINEDWYEGRCHKSTGIFPKAFVEDA